MRKLAIIISFALTLPISIFSQTATQKGSFIIGGTGSLSTSRSEVKITQDEVGTTAAGPTNSLTINATPNLAYFPVNNFAIGLSSDFSFQSIKVDDTRTLDSDFLIGPMMRIYFPFGGNKAALIHFGSGFGSSTDDLIIDGDAVESQTTLMRYGVGPGITLFSNNNVGVEALTLFNYSRTNSTVSGDIEPTQTISTSLGMDVLLGVQFYLSRNR